MKSVVYVFLLFLSITGIVKADKQKALVAFTESKAAIQEYQRLESLGYRPIPGERPQALLVQRKYGHDRSYFAETYLVSLSLSNQAGIVQSVSATINISSGTALDPSVRTIELGNAIRSEQFVKQRD